MHASINYYIISIYRVVNDSRINTTSTIAKSSLVTQSPNLKTLGHETKQRAACVWIALQTMRTTGNQVHDSG